ncbi:unnamed protein product [Linum trigynum]|uniref:Uncharacterized protein n=1 Tax=Linum trigynum TaxID=586398 RepID=A0AAV2GJM4_9ROSI
MAAIKSCSAGRFKSPAISLRQASAGGRIKMPAFPIINLRPGIKLSASASRAIKCVLSEFLAVADPIKDSSITVEGLRQLDDGGGGADDGSGENGGFHGGGGGGGRGGDDAAEKEVWPIMLLADEDVIKMADEVRGLELPAYMPEAAEAAGIRTQFLLNQMMADPGFLFHVGTKVVIGSCSAAVAEFVKWGKDLWSKLEMWKAFAAITVNVSVVNMLARIGKPYTACLVPPSTEEACAALPSSVVEAGRPGHRSSLMQQLATYFYKGSLYGSVAFGCGLLGQGIANTIMNIKRRVMKLEEDITVNKSEEDIPTPLQVGTGILRGVFRGASSCTPYQVIKGMERVVEAALPLVRQAPPLPNPSTVGVPFTCNIANNINGGGIDGTLCLLVIIFAIFCLVLAFTAVLL